MKLKTFGKIVFIILTTTWFSIALANIHIFSDTEGSTSKIDALVSEGKLKWVSTSNGKMLEFTNKKDAVVFLGDLSGPNWLDPENPHNIMIRNALLDLKTRYPKRVDLVLGNHEFNRLGFVRDNIRIAHGEHPQYTKWLLEKGQKDSTLNRVMFWGTNAYGVNKEGVPQPLEQYQQELTNSKGVKVSLEEAAEQFAKDLKVGKGSEPHGKMLQYILAGQESVVRNGYAFTHASITAESLGIVPLQEKKVVGGATWLIERNENFFKPQMNQFITDIQKDKIPASILAEIGDARWDSIGKRVVHDSNSITYTERPREGDQYRGSDQKVVKSFAEDPKQPLKGIFTGHKPAGDFATAHRQETNGKLFFDIDVDTSRGPNGMHSTTTLLDSGELEIRGKTAEGKFERWIVGQNGDKLVGRINEDGFHIKGITSDGRYILERYQGYNLEQKIVSKDSIDPKKTILSSVDSSQENSLQAKVASLKESIKSSGGAVLADFDEASRLVGDRFVLDLRGASSWAAVDDAKSEKIKQELIKLSKSLDPKKVVIITGGNRASHSNAVENIVHDVFAGPDVKEKFDIIGFMKHNTPADEVDKSVKYVVLIGDGDNWDGPVQAAQKFVSERKGASLMIGGGGILKRAADTEVALKMKDRLFLLQGYGGASEEKVAKGTAISSIDELVAGIEKLDEKAIISSSKLKAGVVSKNVLSEKAEKTNPKKLQFVKDSPTLAYRITSDRFDDIPNEIRKHLGEVDKTKYTSEYLKKNIGSVFALQMNGDAPDFYVIGKETFDAKYASVPLEDVTKKNAKYLGKLTTQIPDLVAKKDGGLIAVLKTVPTEMIRMSDIGYPLDREVVIESPWGEQTKPAGKDAFLVWDDSKKQYYMVNVGEDGNPLSYVVRSTPELSPKNVKVEPLVHAERHQGEEKILAVGLSGAVVKTTHKDLKVTETKLNPVKENFVKDSPFLAYQIKSDRIEDVPEEIRKILLASGKVNEVQTYLRENVGSAIALQMNNGKEDFYIIGKEVFDSKYTAVPLDDVGQKNQAYLDDIKKKIPSTLKKGSENLIAVLKTTPTEMVRMSDLGFPINKTVIIEAPWGSQVKPAGSDAYVTWDTAKKRYYMVVAGADGNPLNYVNEGTLTKRLDLSRNKVSVPFISDEVSELKKLPENINLKCVESALLNAAK